MGEVPTLTVEAHVFQIDPKTKKQWLPLSSKAVQVSFYRDNNNSTNRIVCVHENKVLINSTLTAASKFTKTSSKFGQWIDHAASTVYGLGFDKEDDLDKFAITFTSSSSPAVKDNPGISTVDSSVQDKIKGFQKSGFSHDANKNHDTNNNEQHKNGVANSATTTMTTATTNANGVVPAVAVKPIANKPAPKLPNNRLSNSYNQNNKLNGFHGDVCGDVRCVATVKGLREENEKLKEELAASKQKMVEWEEFSKLRSENTLLRTSLEENKRNVDGWKKRVDEYRVEINTQRARIQEMDRLEIQLTEQTERLKEVERMNEDKRQELLQFSKVSEECTVAKSVNKKLSAKLKDMEIQNRAVEEELRGLKMRGGGGGGGGVANGDGKQLLRLQEQISHKINELYEMNDQLAEHLQTFV